MTIYAVFTDNGTKAAFFDDRVHGLRRLITYADGGKVISDEPNPETMIPLDAVVISDEDHADWMENQGFRRWDGTKIVPHALPLTEEDYSSAIRLHLDRKAGERGYDSIHTAIGYRGDPNAQFAAEAEALFAWRSEVWTYATAELAKVMSGQREQPTLEALIAELPAFSWPD